MLGPTQVNGLMVDSVSSESLNVSWAVPKDCHVTDYVVTYEVTLLDQCQQVSDHPQNKITSTTNVTIDGLKGFSTYSVEVSGRVDGAQGEIVTGTNTTGETGVLEVHGI